ncbi:N-acetylneuraminate synthase family protein [bacterium]|nr:N-acetylneuraminate synthase family protein [bacterium]
MAIKLGERLLPPEGLCLVSLEVGMNHNGDMGLAEEMIAAAAEVGADAVKFQSFQTHRLVLPDDPSWAFRKSVELSRAQHERLRDACARYNLLFLSTPCDEEGVDLLVSLGCAAIKLGSFDLTHHPLLAHAARTGLPMILSTGVATLAEIEEAVGVMRKNGDPPLILLHCVSRYPAPEAEVNLAAMETLAQAFSVPVGFSDHTLGVGAAASAAGLGAVVIEKHFTLDKRLAGPDQAISADPEEARRLVRAVREAEAARGRPEIRPSPEELELGRLARRSLWTTRAIMKGEAFSADNIDVLRPPVGLAPKHLPTVLQRRAAEDIPAHTPLAWKHLSD